MNPSEILSFLTPQFGDSLQLVFFAIILFMTGFTVVSAHRTARPASWEHKWNRGTPDDTTDDLDIEHGSVTDLWHAVATAPEKLAEIMPGMLLVVGLLGTFLGLGLALNHASSILGQADLASAGAAADSMQNLLGLLQGLGTKFKTSTWGILGFVLLKIWSEVTRFEEKRLAWVIGKVKAELENRKRAQAAAEKAREDALFANIGRAAAGIVDGIGPHFVALIKSNETMQLQTLQHLHALDGSTQGLRNALDTVASETAATRSAMVEFTEGTQHVVAGMEQAAQRMADGAGKVGSGAEQLVGAIRTFESQFTEVLDNVRGDLGKAIQDMSAQASETLERGSTQLGSATREISTALGELSADTRETMNEVKSSIGKSLQIQEKASIAFTTSSRALNENIAETTGIVNAMTSSITEGLESIGSATSQIKKVAEASKKSSEGLERVVAELQGLPSVLAPLQSLLDEQKMLVYSLQPLPEIVQVQRATVALLQAMQAEQQTPPAPTGTSASAIA
ncbi:hypothetical protein [Massilia sp.]|uniref:hypothetical protein n=1 Tax=Massilia sp. TaxID=1882437 RepID=UPI00289D19FC|nr:hypothetical protein [Massilia sp.]